MLQELQKCNSINCGHSAVQTIAFLEKMGLNSAKYYGDGILS
jgi:hypothetical protein